MDTQKLTELVKGLSQQEAEEVINRVQAAMDNEVEKYVSGKEAKRIEALTAEYRTKMTDPAIRGQAWKLKQIKENYRGLGVPVDQVDFS